MFHHLLSLDELTPEGHGIERKNKVVEHWQSIPGWKSLSTSQPTSQNQIYPKWKGGGYLWFTECEKAKIFSYSLLTKCCKWSRGWLVFLELAGQRIPRQLPCSEQETGKVVLTSLSQNSSENTARVWYVMSLPTLTIPFQLHAMNKQCGPSQKHNP